MNDVDSTLHRLSHLQVVDNIDRAVMFAATSSMKTMLVSWDAGTGEWVLDPNNPNEYTIRIPNSWEARLALFSIYGDSFCRSLPYHVSREFPKDVLEDFSKIVSAMRDLRGKQPAPSVTRERRIRYVATLIEDARTAAPRWKALSEASLFVDDE